MLKVFSAQHPTEAHLVKGILESYDIQCKVRGESIFSIRGELPITPETAPTIWIFDDSKFEEARSIIREYEASAGKEMSSQEIWICEACGEDSESQFTKCWNCGKTRQE